MKKGCRRFKKLKIHIGIMFLSKTILNEIFL